MTEPTVTRATFTIDMQPAEPLLDGTGRFDFRKAWSGGLAGSGTGLMLSAGDPASGSAGYVALETVSGVLDGRQGSLAFQQSGVMTADGQQLSYRIVPGSGTDELAGIAGEVALDVVDGVHQVEIRYTL